MKKKQTEKIGTTTATIIGMNAMIGSGIFSAPAVMAAHVGPGGIIAYILVIASVWFIAQSMARLAFLYPQEGSFYAYTKPWAGHIGGMIASSLYLTGLLIAMGLLSQMAGLYLEPFFPAYTAYTLGIVTLALLVFLNMFGVVLSQFGQQVLIFCTLFPLIATTLICFSHANPTYLFPFFPHGFTNVLKATRVVIFGFFGFECAASLFTIVKNPQKTIPRALTYAIGIVGLVYTLFITSIIISTPLALFSDPRIKITDIIAQNFSGARLLTTFIHISILSAILGTIHSMIWSSSSLLGQLVKKMKNRLAVHLNAKGVINQKTSVFLIGIFIFINYCILENINLFFNFTAVFIICALILSLITLLTQKSEWSSGQNIKTIIGLTTAFAILIFAIEGIVDELMLLYANAY